MDALLTDLKPSWQALCRFAYETFDRDQIVFSEEELATCFPQGLALDKNIHCFGLLQSSLSVLKEGHGVSFNFLHLIIQEYLAALYLVDQLLYKHTGAMNQWPQVFKRKFFESHPDSWHFENVWSLIFSIYFNEVRESDHQIIKPYLRYPNDEVLVCHCAFEVKNDGINHDITRTLKAIRHNALISFLSNSTHDCAAIIYVIDKLQELVIIKVNFSDCSVQEELMTCLADALEKNGANVKVAELDLKGNKLTNLSVLNLFQRASCSFQSLENLRLSNNKIGIGSTNVFQRNHHSVDYHC